MRCIRYFLFALTLTATQVALADELDDFLEAFGRKDWVSCIRLAKLFDPMSRFIFDDEGVDVETTPLFVILNNLGDETPQDVLGRIELILSILPSIDPDLVLDSRYPDTAFEAFLDEVAKMDLFGEFSDALLALCIAFFERDGQITPRMRRVIERTPILRDAFAIFQERRRPKESPRDEPPLRQRPAKREGRERASTHQKRPRSSSHGFHIKITPAMNNAKTARAEGPDSAGAMLSPTTPGSAPDRMVPDTPRFAARRTDIDPNSGLPSLLMQMQNLVTALTQRVMGLERRLQEEEAARVQVANQRELDITQAVERTLARLGFLSSRAESKQ